MKIAILSLSLHTNYGGILQTYALQTILERMGHNVEALERPLTQCVIPYWKRPFTYTKRIIKRYIFGDKKVHVNEEQFWYESQIKIRSNTQQFINKYIHQRYITDFREIKENDYDVFVVGSDQIWRLNSFKASWNLDLDIEVAYLSFTQGWDVRRIAYAASFGVDSLNYSQQEKEICKKLIHLFNSVSVRENSAIRICQLNFKITPVWVLDPTMLLTETDYQNLFAKDGKESINSFILSYILDTNEEKSAIEKRIANDLNLQIQETNAKVEDKGATIEERTQPPVGEWLKAFAHTSFVVTDSFHACVFSILFHKQFIVIGNNERGMARFQSLLNMFGLEDRLINSYHDYQKLSKIDYAQINNKLYRLRNFSMEFLFKSLSQ